MFFELCPLMEERTAMTSRHVYEYHVCTLRLRTCCVFFTTVCWEVVVKCGENRKVMFSRDLSLAN